jgi:predicted RNA binding protein YcfA (HicA-like mRNA interferase family)
MKRREFLRYLARQGCHVVAEGGRHTAVMNFANNRKSYIPRHNELKRGTIRAICKQLGIPAPF